MTAKWTFMVYIAEMAKVGSSEDLNIVVQLDRARDRLSVHNLPTDPSGQAGAQTGRVI